MRPLILLVALFLPGALAMGDSPPDDKTGEKEALTPSVGVFLDFDFRPGNSSVEIMKKEVDDLLKPSGIHLDWRLTGDNSGKETFSGVVVVKFKGRCRAESWNQSASDFGSVGETVRLGATEVKDGRVLPFTEVECDQVRKALDYVHPGGDRQKALGLAMGRVVAHELYHILAHTTGHATEGLAKATRSLRDLITPWGPGFREKDTEAMRKGFHPTPVN